MEVEFQRRADSPFDLKRLGIGSAHSEHLLTVVIVKVRGRIAEVCLLARSEVTILRAGARKTLPAEARPSEDPPRYHNLKLALGRGEELFIGPDLMTLKVVDISRGRVDFSASIAGDGLSLNLSPLEDVQEWNPRDIIERLNRGADYRRGVGE